MDRIKVGVIGCGYWGPKLARNFHEMPEAELSCVADFRPERLAHMKQLYPYIRITQDHRDILRSDVEAVVIATPVATHYSLTMEALAAGKHVLVEKPLAATLSHAREIALTAERLGLVAMVGHTFQHNPAVNAMRELIVTGELGDIYYIDMERVNLGLFQPDINVVWDLAPHDISILLHVLGAMPEAVSAQGKAFIQRARGLHDVAYLTLHFPGDVMANIRISWLDPVKIRRITVVGSHQMLVYDDIADDKLMLYDRGVDVPPYSDTLEQFNMSYRQGPGKPVPFAWREPLRVECEAFVNWIRGGPRPCSDAWMGVKVVQVLETAQRSLINGGGREPMIS